MRFFIYFLLIFFTNSMLVGCHSDDSNFIEPTPTPPDQSPPVDSGALDWVEGFPLISTSYQAISIRTKITQPGKVYYVVSENELENVTGSEIKRLALQEENDPLDNTTGGVLNISSENLEDTLSVILNGFNSGENVYSYYIAEGTKGDSSYLMSDENLIISTSLVKDREQENKYFSSKRGGEINYLFYALEDYYLNPLKDYPLLIFLHGKGEYGSKTGDLDLYKNGTIPELIHEGTDLPFIVVSPQIDTGRWDTDFVDEFIDYVIATYRVDEERIYMTGNSLGGVGTWEYASAYPDRLAAMVPISGHGFPLEACKFKDTPVWAFHNSVDPIVETTGSTDMVDALNNCQPPGIYSPILTIYPEEGHDAWKRTYDGSAGHDIFSWMLSYKKNS